MAFETLEAAQEEIVRLNDEVTRLTNERDTLSQNNVKLTEDNERIRTLNQNYFNRLQAQVSPQTTKTKEDDEVVSCEDFAKTLKI